MVKQRTVEKYLMVLNDMKSMVSFGHKLKTKDIATKHHVGKTVPKLAKEMGFFSLDNAGNWICNRSQFTMIDARKLATKAAEYYPIRTHIDTRDQDVNLFSEETDEELIAKFHKRGFVIIDGSIYKKVG